MLSRVRCCRDIRRPFGLRAVDGGSWIEPPPIGPAENPRPVHGLAKDGALDDGATYEGWPCRVCSRFIATDQSWPDAARIPNAHGVVAACPGAKQIAPGLAEIDEKA